MLISRSVHPLPGEAERRARFVSLVDAFNGRRVLIVGDLIADEFIYGQVARVSREAPVLILQYDATEILRRYHRDVLMTDSNPSGIAKRLASLVKEFVEKDPRYQSRIDQYGP